MAKKSSALSLFRGPTFAAPKPLVIQLRQPSGMAKKHHHKAKRHHGGGEGSRELFNKRRMGIAMMGGLVKFLQSKFQGQIPALPVVGEYGTIALGAHFLSDKGRNKFADEACTAAFVLAFAELGDSLGQGKPIVGGGDEFDPTSFVTGA